MFFFHEYWMRDKIVKIQEENYQLNRRIKTGHIYIYTKFIKRLLNQHTM